MNHLVIAMLLVAILAVSSVAQVHSVSALSAATVTNQPTFSSLTSNKWQRVLSEDCCSILFDGSSSYAKASTSSALDVTTQNFAIFGYIYPTSTTGSDENIVHKFDGNNGYTIFINSSNKLVLLVRSGGNSAQVTSTMSIVPGTWYLIAASMDRPGSETLRIYNFDNQSSEANSASMSAVTGSITTNNVFHIGRNSGGASNYFPGNIGYVGFVNNGLISSSQFSSMIAGDFSNAGATSLYAFTESSGSTAFDSISGNNLSLQGSPTWFAKVGPGAPSKSKSYFVDGNTGSVKSVLINGTGAVMSSVSTATVGAPVTVSSLTASSSRTDTLFKQDAGGSTQSLLTGSTTFQTEYIATSSSALVGQTVNSITLSLKKTGSPTGNAVIACFDSSGNTSIQFGTQDVSLLTGSFQTLTYTTTTASRTLANGDRCGVFYNGGSVGNTLDVEYSATDVYDGTTNSIVSTATGAQGSASWTSQTTREQRMALSYAYSSSNINLATFTSGELFENQGQLVRAVQSNFDTTTGIGLGGSTGNLLTQSSGALANSTLDSTNSWAVGEHVNSGSALIGKAVNSLTVGLRKGLGSPVGTATACIMDSSGNCTYTFGTVNVATLTTSYAATTFTNSASLYQIQLGDYIGIKYQPQNGVQNGNTLMIGSSTANAYDSTNSAKAFYSRTNTNQYSVASDDTSWNVNSINRIFAGEAAFNSNSVLVGKTINEITLLLRKTGSPTGTAYIGVWSNQVTPTNANYKFLAGTIDVSTVSTSATAYTFTSASGYTLTTNDVVGIFFNGGDASNYVAVFSLSTDPVDSSNTRGMTYLSSWNSLSPTTHDVRMTMTNYSTAWAADTTTDLGSSTANTNFKLDTTMTIVAEAAKASSTLIASNSFDTLKATLRKTGSPTGTITAAVFDSNGNIVSTFGTMSASSLTTSPAVYTFQSSSLISISSGQYAGIQYLGGSAGNTVDVYSTASNPYDTTNSVLSKFAGSWTDTSTADFTFKLSQEVSGSASQEAGANIIADFASNQNTGGMYVYWPDSTKIPQTIKLSTSTDNVSYVDRLTINPSQSTGAQYISFDQSYSVRYVKLTVVTWGSAKSMQLAQFVRLPGSTSTAMALSAIEDNGSIRSVFYVQYSGALSNAYVGQINIDSGQIMSAITFASGSGGWFTGDVTIQASKNRIYVDYASGSAWLHNSMNRDLTGVSGSNTSGTTSHSSACEISVDGAAAANDVYYCAVSGAPTIIYKVDGATLTATNIGTITGNSATVVELVNLADKMVVRASSGGVERTATITKATDSVSGVLYTTAWSSYSPQQYDFTGTSARTFKSNTEAYYATATKAIHWSPQGVLTDPAEIYAESLDSSSGTISNVAGKLYRISDNLIISGSGTVWTPKLVSASTVISPTAYTEKLNVPLVLNTTGIFDANVVKLVCDTSYSFPTAGKLYVNDDSDCIEWRVLATSGVTVGRENTPYSRNAELVYANPLTAYTFVLSDVSNPGQYFIKSIYSGKVVDENLFDVSASVQQRYLYGQCYELVLSNTFTNVQTILEPVCANDLTTKSLKKGSGISMSVPGNIVGTQWQRNWTFTDPINGYHDIAYAVKGEIQPFDISLWVTNSLNENNATIKTWHNFTNVSGYANLALLGISTNSTIYVKGYSNNALQFADVLVTVPIQPIQNPFAWMGTMGGIPFIPFIAVTIFGAIWTRQYETYAILGLMIIVGMLYGIGWFPQLDALKVAGIEIVGGIGLFAVRRNGG